ncbi:Ctf8p and Ctf18p associating protein [Rhodotorula kratochvilovae]
MAPLAAHERLLVFADKARDPPAAASTSYQLLALPPALLALVSSPAADGAAPLEIRGDEGDSAVLVTATQTFAVRGVQNSNSLCVCASGAGAATGRRKWFVQGGDEGGEDVMEEEGDEPARKKARYEPLEIETVLHETLEAVPGVARTEKLEALLKGAEYRGDAEEEDAKDQDLAIRHTFDSIRSRLPASDAEIRTALSRNRIVTLDGFLRPLPPAFRLKLLPSVLSTLPLPAELAHPAAAAKKKDKGKGKEAKPAAAAPAPGAKAVLAEALEVDLLDALDAVDCGSEEVARELLAWFGEEVEVGGKKRWRLDAAQVVRELGVVLLADGGFGQQPHDAFLARWKSLSGGFAPVCYLALLAGVHLFRPPPLSTVQYLPPSSLSPDPAARFAELFSLKPRWLEAEMSLFVDDLTGGDKKKRDALVLKFVRKVKEKDTTWWTARNLWT